jgi:hypothetical protein
MPEVKKYPGSNEPGIEEKNSAGVISPADGHYFTCIFQS